MKPFRSHHLLRTARFLALFALFATPAAFGATYEYDDLGRLVRETYDNGAEIVYTYDAVGNRTSRTVTVPPPEPPFFADGFESGDTGGWSNAVPAATQSAVTPAVDEVATNRTTPERSSGAEVDATPGEAVEVALGEGAVEAEGEVALGAGVVDEAAVEDDA